MKTSYIYSSSRVKALQQELLSESDVERLVEAKRGEELIKVLKETYLAKYLMTEDVAGVMKATEQSLIEAKDTITKIAPEPKLFDFLWVFYDLHNLKVQLKAAYAGFPAEKTTSLMSGLGKYSPETLMEHIANDTLNRLESQFKNIYEEAKKAMEEKGLADAEVIIDKEYFKLAKSLVGETRDLSIDTILRLQIDLYNLKTRLRTIQVPRQGNDDWFVEGGNFRFEDIESKEQALANLQKFGGEARWREAIDLFNNEGHSTLIDVKADDYLLETIHVMSYDVFSPASLIAYFVSTQNTAKIIKTILVGKENGQSEDLIRQQLRTVYV